MDLENFGASLMTNDFLLDGGRIHINHGSYGAVPKKVFDARAK